MTTARAERADDTWNRQAMLEHTTRPVPAVAKVQNNEYLKVIGQRVRATRSQKKLSRRELSQKSGISERFIAHLELGDGNISVLKLKALADALEVSTTEFIADEERQDAPPAAAQKDWRAHPNAIAELFRHADHTHQRAVVELLLSSTRKPHPA